MSNKIKPIAIHLPQFHPIPENDIWWGKGFTEWTNVTKAQPRFEGHYQPHLPADLGFYDLRLEEARLAQEQLAKAYGIHGFCYYHYWFNGKRILNEPVDRKMQNPKENFPFMLCWANENWTRTWDGLDKEVLLKQEYSFDDDLVHIQHLISFFKDERYIKVEGKPVFIVYRPNLFPDIQKTISIWREAARNAGFIDLYLGYALNAENRFNPQSLGFDFAFEFQPNSINFPQTIPYPNTTKDKIFRKIKKSLGMRELEIKCYVDYGSYVSNQIQKDFQDNIYPGITPMWDNSARRKENNFILHNSTPLLFKKWLIHIKENYPWNNVPENFLFINAWNEWAEGNHLEPCQKWGTKYLESVKDMLK
ncbi:glycoside hydrolase family 99-like domain-containing protein [Flavobacterium sp. JLP]|uniref:glycosyltransferase WbsX family protein n=1 Tax=Flavobacterium sp. JLP TaxID=2783793 RepID=UPI00188DB81B|nr:glycoside hydrolase family 99-like domain-containing protein [Flavobacterium sp. JLP]MBF4507142.1 glycoside hydrolase family 99-like domain-containing protein [Flavobacterium sp. JLP]